MNNPRLPVISPMCDLTTMLDCAQSHRKNGKQSHKCSWIHPDVKTVLVDLDVFTDTDSEF